MLQPCGKSKDCFSKVVCCGNKGFAAMQAFPSSSIFQISQETKPPTLNRVDFLLLSAAALVVLSAAVPVVLRMATGKSTGNSSEQPNDFRYYQIYASEAGTTHFGKWKMTGFDLQPYGSKPQYVRSDFGGEPTKLVFTELAVGLEQPLHSCPAVQFVVTLSGSWYVKTTDGTKFAFKPGDVLFQDNTKNSPADKQPEHYSGVVGDQPCQQMIVQLLRPPQVNEPNPF